MTFGARLRRLERLSPLSCGCYRNANGHRLHVVLDERSESQMAEGRAMADAWAACPADHGPKDEPVVAIVRKYSATDRDHQPGGFETHVPNPEARP